MDETRQLKELTDAVIDVSTDLNFALSEILELKKSVVKLNERIQELEKNG
jgi:hypothetical protein